MFLSEFVWNKPVLSLYRENNEQPEREAFAVIKVKKLTVSKSENGDYKGNIAQDCEDYCRAHPGSCSVEITKKAVYFPGAQVLPEKNSLG